MKKSVIILVLLITLCSIVWADLGDELIDAARDGDLTEVERLLEAGADVNWHNEWGSTALMWGYTKIVELLVIAGADVNLEDNGGMTALMWAIEYGNAEIVELLLNAGAVE